MKTQNAMVWLAVTSLMVCMAGCGKKESTSPQPSEAANPPKAEKAKEMASAQPQAQQLINTSATTVTTPPISIQTETSKVFSATGSPPGAVQGTAGQPAIGLASLSQDQVVRGLQEALAKGLQQAVARLGHDGGFLTNLNVKIPMPEKLQKVETTLRAMKQDKLADDFVATMNHAAEQAVPEAGAVFADALKQMTIQDATSILTSTNDAATQYFRNATQTNLYARFYPIVQKATQATGVTAAYKSLMEKANVGGITQKLGGLGSSLGGALLDKDSIDLDAYVTNKAMDGLFKMVAEEEKQIRQNPVARTTDLLQKVFGALKTGS